MTTSTSLSLSFLEYMRLGGSIMWIILVLSVIAVAVVFERIIFFIGASTDPETLEREFGRAISEGDAAAVRRAATGRSSMHRLFSAAYAHWMLDGDEMKALVEGQVRREIYKWERNMTLLETIAKVAPLLGLLGTVLGMVDMFQTLNLGGSVSAEAVTGGIWKALFTTVAGLIVAIPVIIVHGLLAGRISKEDEQLERGGEFIVMEHLLRRNSGQN